MEQKQKSIRSVFRTLSLMECEILKFRIGCYGDIFTYLEVGCIFKVTAERIRQIESKAIRRLRTGVRAKLLREECGPIPSSNEDFKAQLALWHGPADYDFPEELDFIVSKVREAKEKVDLIKNLSPWDRFRINTSARARKACIRLGASSIEKVCSHTISDFLDCKNCGVATVRELREVLARMGLFLKNDDGIQPAWKEGVKKISKENDSC